MVSVLVLILISVYLYLIYLNRRLDRRKLSHSSYYDLAFGGERKCGQEAAEVLGSIGGHRRILCNWHYVSQTGPAVADVILIHETGIYVVEAKDYQGWISGALDEEYWIQTLYAGQLSSNRNYFYNPVLKMQECEECLKKLLPDMQWLPYFSLAVFGNGCELENAGLTSQDTKIILLRQLSYTVYDMVRNAHKFLAPQVIDEIYERLSVQCTEGAAGGKRAEAERKTAENRKRRGKRFLA